MGSASRRAHARSSAGSGGCRRFSAAFRTRRRKYFHSVPKPRDAERSEFAPRSERIAARWRGGSSVRSTSAMVRLRSGLECSVSPANRQVPTDADSSSATSSGSPARLDRRADTATLCLTTPRNHARRDVVGSARRRSAQSLASCSVTISAAVSSASWTTRARPRATASVEAAASARNVVHASLGLRTKRSSHSPIVVTSTPLTREPQPGTSVEGDRTRVKPTGLTAPRDPRRRLPLVPTRKCKCGKIE